MKWFRMHAEFATDPKILALSDAMYRRYVTLLCLKSNGDLDFVTRSNGEIALRVTASALRITEEEALETKKALVQFELIEENWNIKNWDKRQYISDLKDPTNSERQKRHRNGRVTVEKRSSNGPVTPQKQIQITDTEKLASCANDFWEEEVLPSRWQDIAENRGIPNEQIFKSWRKFKDTTGIPYEFSRWKAWVDREKISA